MVDIMGLMKKAQAVQAKMKDVQEELERLEVEGQSGGGMVRITLTGKGEMKSIHLDPSLLKPRRFTRAPCSVKRNTRGWIRL